MTTDREPVSATRRALFAGGLGIAAAAAALPATASDADRSRHSGLGGAVEQVSRPLQRLAK